MTLLTPIGTACADVPLKLKVLPLVPAASVPAGVVPLIVNEPARLRVPAPPDISIWLLAAFGVGRFAALKMRFPLTVTEPVVVVSCVTRFELSVVAPVLNR